ncbi:MAG TPA: EF-hand domain-containing protein [Burkholderiales bacterium]|nr:EF-hand domain-containing protein [Burkholderiales bacterium]
MGRPWRIYFYDLKETIMFKTCLFSSTLALVAVLASPSITLADNVGKLDAAFKAADKDNDGTLDKQEAKALPRVAKNFDAIDADKDGTVSMDEIKAFMKQAKHEGAAAFKKADADNDGTLDKEEAKAMPGVAKNFDAIDTDHDGTVSMDEIKAFMNAKHAKTQ